MGPPILTKLATEVGVIEIFQKAKLVLFSDFQFKSYRWSHLGPPELEKSCFSKGKFGKP